MSSNLPPGVTEGMLPGNRPEDIVWDNFFDWAADELSMELCVDEARRAVIIGIAAVKAERKSICLMIKEHIKEDRAVREMERLADAEWDTEPPPPAEES